jgi:hypothetical protein
VAAAALGSQTGLYRSHGPAGAPYALAVLDVLEPAPPADPAP